MQKFEITIHMMQTTFVVRQKAWRSVVGIFRARVSETDYLHYFNEKSNLQCIFEGLSKFTTFADGSVILVEFWKDKSLERRVSREEALGKKAGGGAAQNL